MGRFQRRYEDSPAFRVAVIGVFSLALLLPAAFLLWGGATPAPPIRIDGSFSDWVSVAKVPAVPAPAAVNPDTDIVSVAVTDSGRSLAFYVRVQGSVLSGGPAPASVTNAFYAFVDVDRSAATGYRVQGIGADRMVRIYTWGGQVVGASLFEFDASRGPRDWNGWTAFASVDAAGSGGQLEFQVPWLELGATSGPAEVAFASRSWDGQSDAADVVVTDSVPYVLVSQDTAAPTVLSTATPTLATFTFHAVDGDVSLSGINVTLVGTFLGSSLSAVDLVDENGTLLGEQPASGTVRFTFSGVTVSPGANRSLYLRPKVATVDGTTVGAFLQDLEDVRTSAGVAFVAPTRIPAALAYVGSVPNVPVVDGAFSDWSNLTADPVGDVVPQWNPDVDLSGYAFRPSGGSTYFMARLVGTALNGTMVPALNPVYVPPANSTGNGSVGPPPPPENGTDVIRLFLDADGSASTGYAIGGLGADYLIEITGKQGLILSSDAMRFTGPNPWQWSWALLGPAPTAKDLSRVEAALPGVAVTNASRAFFQTSGWGGSTDDSSTGVTPSVASMGPFLIRTLTANPLSTLSLSSVTTGTGAAGGDEYGFNVTGVGRINSASGSYESFVIGAPYALSGKGAIYIFFGYAGWSPANINAASANVTITGQTAGDHFGWSVAAAGDVNGDGLMDILVGAPDAGTGKAYLIYGRTSWTGVSGSAINAVANVVTITGQNTGDKFGSSVAGLGNVNNVGNADIAVGAYAYASRKGRVYVLYDNATMPTVASQASLFLDGTSAGDEFGFSIAGGGIVNGGSYSNFVIGAPGASKAYVYTLGINPVSNGFLTSNANGWTFGKVDPNSFDSGAWDNTGGSTPDSSGAGSYRFTFADTVSTLTLYFHAEQVTDNTKTAFALLSTTTDLSSAASSQVTATANGQHLILGNWTTPALGITSITAGTWTFSYDAATGNGITTANLDVHIYKLSSTGVLTAIDGTNGADSTLGVAATANIVNPGIYTGTYAMAATALAITDALYIRVYAAITTLGSQSGKTVTFSYDSSTASSTVVTTAAFPETRFFHVETASVNGFTDQQLLTTAPDKPAVQSGSASVTTSATGHFFLAEWAFPQMGITSIPAGDWNFYYWGTSSAADARFDVHIYTRSASGVLTSVDGTNGLNTTVGVASTTTITATGGNPGQLGGSVNLGSIALATTDAVVVRVYANVLTVGTNKQITFDYDSSATNGPNSRLIYPGKTYTDRLYIVSTVAFTSPPGSYSNVRFRLSYTSTVTNLGDASYKVKFQIRNSGDNTTVATAYDSGPLITAQSWSLQTGTFTGLSSSTGYRVRVMLEVYDVNQGQTPSITANVDDIDLQFEALTTLTGSANTNFGWSVALMAPAAGLTTFNNDNYADVVVGAPETANGQVTVYYGAPTFGSTAAVTITGAASGDKFGYSVSSAADFNGDGISDLVIGAPYHTNGAATATGAIYVFTGSSSPSSSMTTANAFNFAYGENSNDHFGWSVSYSHPGGASTSFLLVGAPNFSVPNSNEGKSYVLGVPEFGDVLLPVAGALVLVLGFRGLARRRRHPAA